MNHHLCVKMEIDRLGFIHENFFPGDSLKKQGNIVHEISLFFYMDVPTDFEPMCDSFTEDGDQERLVWISADHPKKYYPEFFKTELANPSKDIKHYVTKNNWLTRSDSPLHFTYFPISLPKYFL